MTYANQLREEISSLSNPSNRKQMEAYMKNLFVFFGVKSPERKAVLKSFLKQYGLPRIDETENVTKELWSFRERELHYSAMEIVHRTKYINEEASIELLEWMITNNSWWDTVDFIASNLCGIYFKKHPQMINSVATKWNKSDNMWLIRTSILYQLKYKDLTNTSLMNAFIKPHLNSKEFFIQKAIGWALRQYSKSNPAWVEDFVNSHELKPVSKREAVKYL